MSELLAAGSVVLFTALSVVVVVVARRGQLSHRQLVVLSCACALGLLAMTVTDWPVENLAGFWSRHSVLSATLSTLLLVGAGFLAFEARDNLEQQQLSESLATAAFGGLVDHALDVDLALALLVDVREPDELRAPAKPLRWLRPLRDNLPEDQDQARHDARDPRCRLAGATLPDDEGVEWRLLLLDQALRRIMAAMRDWAPLLCQTRQGTAVLVRLGLLRNELLRLQREVRAGDRDRAHARITSLRAECQVLALGLELGSGVRTDELRAGVLRTLAPGLVHAPAADELKALCQAADEPGNDAGKAAAQVRRLLADGRGHVRGERAEERAARRAAVRA